VLVNLVAKSTGLLVPHAVLAVEDALHNGRYSPVSVRRLGGVGGVAVRCGNVGKKVPSVLRAHDPELGQGNEERFANAEGRNAIGFMEAGMFCHGERSFQPLTYSGQALTALICIGESRDFAKGHAATSPFALGTHAMTEAIG
jgi:hypothetical protein